MVISGGEPLRARKIIEFWGGIEAFPAQPQCVSRCQLNLRRRKRLASSRTAAIATITSDRSCCQPILAKYAENSGVQQNFPPIFATHRRFLKCLGGQPKNSQPFNLGRA